jgi:hypothetical protein
MGKYSDGLLGAQPVAEQGGTQPSAPGKYSSELLGTPASATQEAPTQQPEQPEQGWGEWLKESVVGKKDPAYEGTGTVFEQFPGELRWPTANAATLGASDPQMGDIVQKALGDRFIRREQDANGYEVFVTKGQDGSEQRGYLNAPGLDTQDVSRSIYGAMPYLATGMGAGALATRAGVGALSSAALQGAGAGATSIAGDLAQVPMGSEQGIEWGKAGTMAAFGAGGDLLGRGVNSAIQKFIVEPKYFDRATGKLTPLGERAAVSMGMDPKALAPELQKTFAKTYAASPNDVPSLIQSVSDQEFNIPSSLGQRTKDYKQLMREKGMRSDLYGRKAKEKIVSLDENQLASIKRSVQETVPGTILDEVAPVPVSGAPAEFGEKILDRVKSAKGVAKAKERAAWDATEDIVPTGEAVTLLPSHVRDRLKDLPFDDVNTPTAFNMGRQLEAFMKGEAPTGELDKTFGLTRPKTLDAVRRQLLAISRNAQTPTDKTASKAMYNAFDDWMTQAAQQGLISGDVAAVTAFRNARDITKEMNSIFAPSQGKSLTPGGKILEQMQASADTPERVVSLLFSGPKAEIKTGAVEAINSVKKGFDKYLPPDEAKAAWNDLRLAHWSRLFQGGDGKVLGKDALKSSLQHALNKQSSLMKVLYRPQEIEQMRRFVSQLEKVTYKDPNPSGTATGVAVFAKQFLGKLLDAFGPLGRTAFEYSGIPTAYGSAIASKAVAQNAARLPKPPTFGYAAPTVAQGINTDQPKPLVHRSKYRDQ